MTKGMNDFCFLHQTGIFEYITKDENGKLTSSKDRLALKFFTKFQDMFRRFSSKSIVNIRF